MGGIAVSDGPTLPSTSGSSWKLAKSVAEDAQGLVTSGFGKLPAACALLLSAGTKGGAWIEALQAVAPVTDANAKTTPSVALAFTSLGLAQIGLHKDLVDGFARPFVDGMMQEDRRRRLGDVDGNGKPFAPVLWGLRPKTEDKSDTPAAAPEPAIGSAAEAATAGRPIHALLLVYHKRHPQLIELVDGTIVPALKRVDVSVTRRIALDLGTGGGTDTDSNDVREHFGFVDGISQPIPYGAGTLDASGKPVAQDLLHGVPLGEILLGYPDAHGTTTPGPCIIGTKTPDGFVPSPARPADAAVQALRNQTSQQAHDLALNGSYLVVRELRQDVDGFWDSMKKAADELNMSDPGKPRVDAAWVAERVVGRTRDGHMLRPEGPLPPLPSAPKETEGLPNNDFLFFQRDRHGYGCPLGSHVRRSNPRDGLAYAPHVCADLLKSANAHRILRRGRKFGPDIGGPDSTTGKGLLFICLNGDIARQFEFVQQNWILNPNFATLYDEVDPLVGPKGQMTLPAQPLRRRAAVETFVTLVGGDYFFLPSLSTLRILAALPDPDAAR